MAIGTLALCYNNIEVFRVALKLRRGKPKGQIKSMLPNILSLTALKKQ